MKEKWLKIKDEVTESGCAVWWIYATDGVEYWTVDGPFDSEGAATARLSEIEEDDPRAVPNVLIEQTQKRCPGGRRTTRL